MTNTVCKNKYENGHIVWRNAHGQIHRENGPAIEHSNGSKQWFINGQRHRENGPAFDNRGNNPGVGWWLNDKRHREDGPAVEYDDGRVGYYLHGETGPEIEQKVKENMARIQQKELLDVLFQDQDVSDKINTSSPKISKKL